MQIIPVIDVMGGIVVYASGGNRDHYQPLQSILTMSCEPFEVISALLELHEFKKIYIADLDAIQQQTYDVDFYAGLHKRFPDIEFWLDAGIRTRKDWRIIANIRNIRCVLGSESLEEIDLLQESLLKEQAVLSLDYKEGMFLGHRNIVERPENWPKDVIVMSLDHVGTGAGPDYALLKTTKAFAKDSRIIAAGGIRNEQDLNTLASQEIAATLVASALHRGDISNEVLSHF